MIRNPAVAGQFYPGTKNALTREVESLIDSNAAKTSAIGVVSPHAGYMYSGAVAGSVLSRVAPRRSYVIMGPNHTGLGAEFCLDTSAAWKTPLGEVRIDSALAGAIKKRCPLITSDHAPHAHEHSIEVQIPFLQILQNDFMFVPLVMACAELETYRKIGVAIARAVKDLALERDVAIIASSDMTHYEPQESARNKDAIAIDAVLALDEELLITGVAGHDISMCGCAPTAIMLVAAKELGARHAELVKYQTSGDTSGDYSSVVGYAGILIT